MEKGSKGLSVSKKDNFSEWYSEIVQKAELADLRYNVKGFLVFQPWSVMAMEKMYSLFEKSLREKGHKPYWFPTVIPENNLTKEKEHIKGFTPEVFWVTHGGDSKFEDRLALRPTSETAFYQMFSLWVRSYRDLPFKTYQRANVFRYETKATRPFLRSREFHWIETHCLHANEGDALKQVHQDMETTKEVLHNRLGLPLIFFERPAWDKFPGANKTFAADVLNPDGKVVQQPSTHLISQSFLKAFDVKFKDKDGKEKTPFSTCYGPSISRIFASVVITHGDDKGLRMPWCISPIQIVVVPINNDVKIIEKVNSVAGKLRAKTNFSVEVDNLGDKSVGERLNYWELKGVPIRIDIGPNEIKEKSLTIFRRDIGKKKTIKEDGLEEEIERISEEFDRNLVKQADELFNDRVKTAKDLKTIKKVIEEGGIARVSFCSVDHEGTKCGEKVEEESGAKVRGKKLEEETVSGKCVVCGKKAKEIVYIAREY